MPRTLQRPSRGLLTLVLMAALALATASCSQDEKPSGSKDHVIKVTFTGDQVDPSGERVEVKVGDKITLRVTADAPGEIHAHSDPEQEFSYDVGTTDLTMQLDRPGVVEVEAHNLDVVILQLEVS